MTAADIHSLAAAHALHALPHDEQADFEAHLDGCADCRDEVASFEATAVRLAALADEAPPADVRANVMAMITDVRQDPPSVADDDARDRADDRASDDAREAGGDQPGDPATTLPQVLPPATKSASSPPATWASGITTLAGRLGLGLAAGLLVVAGALGLWAADLNTQLQEREDQAQQVAAVLAADGARTIQVEGTTLVVAPGQDRAVLASSTLATPEASEVLQVWVIGADGPVSAGLIEDPTTPKLLEVPVPEGVLVGVTVEPAGGSEQPTSDPIWAAEV